ncbi:MAG: lipid A export permease/ATP-binding protein MsbA [Mesosutterella sp.]|nr:lipid A export permease/ATP-binding protein MsbA [Mesosutterella sp.]
MKMMRIDPSLRRIFRYLFKYKGKIALATLFMAGTAATSSITAKLLGQLTDLGFYEKETWVVLAAPAALIGITLFFGICTVLSSYLMANASQSVLVELREELYMKVLSWPAYVHQENTTGRICSKFVNEANMALSGATSAIVVMVRDLLQVLGLLGLLFYQNWRLTMVTFLIAPMIVVVLQVISRKLKKIVKESQIAIGRMLSRVQETYEAGRVVKLFGTYDFEEKRFDQVNDEIRRNANNQVRVQSLGTPLTQICTMVGVAFVVAAALFEAQEGKLTIGDFITFLTALLLLKAPIRHLTGLNGTFASITVAAKSIFETMDAPVEKDTGTEIIRKARGEISFDHVFLTYPGQNEPSLRGISFSIRPGEHVALVGQSGSGKTSIVSLVPRFWEPTFGRVLLDGKDLRDYTLKSLRNQISIVSQDVELFDDTIRMNVAYGVPDATEEDVWGALDAAALKEFVQSLPKGLDTHVGEGGSLLSGGQKQRVAIARAILKNAPILILDEATSALDSENEAHVKTAIERLSKGRTCITVAHRFSSIENVDRVLVMDKGRLIESGTVQELLKKNGVFAELWRLQSLSPANERAD